MTCVLDASVFKTYLHYDVVYENNIPAFMIVRTPVHEFHDGKYMTHVSTIDGTMMWCLLPPTFCAFPEDVGLADRHSVLISVHDTTLRAHEHINTQMFYMC